ncbi:hypothetical protein THRCLA_07535 [Thraustotheca clavata]|uniref:Uncharacterized protein n=1 Tax=Thraustotheca clavata TaxID=74557 RepID=A0A1V9ZCW4_9STRA|nr:hypothetical protein THRCLA_07535 [Thraustotheca clavata]
MGIKIRNDAPHDVIVLVFTYLTMPHPSLFYRKTLVISSGERVNCPTWQSAVKIYPWEADANAYAIARQLENTFGKINGARLALAPIGGGQTFVDGVTGAVLESVIELAVDQIIENLEERITRADEKLVQRSRQALQLAHQNSKGAFTRTKTKKLFFITQNALFLRRQYKIHQSYYSGRLEIDGVVRLEDDFF